MNRSRHERVVGEARAACGEQRFDELFAPGRTVPLHDAFAEAMTLFATGTMLAGTSKPTPAVSLGLPPRELDVLRLPAEGLSDREIAEALHLSPRTVGWHVNHVLTKQDVPGRTTAATAAVHHELI